MKLKRHHVIIQYSISDDDGDLSYFPIDEELDKGLRKFFTDRGYEEQGSGSGFGERDMEFTKEGHHG
jgi:hypothetical protein